MRQIKFRAWDKVNKKVRKVMSLDFYNTRQSEVTLASDGDVYLRYFEQVELMQSTGLKDKNGKEIYEGDIVIAWSQGYQATGEVKQRIDGLWLMYPAYQHGKQWGLCPNPKGGTTVEIIGNIYEDEEEIKRGASK